MAKAIILKDRYEITTMLGHGGFARTYSGIDRKTRRKCAIKCVTFQTIKEWKTWELFEREVKVLQNLEHPNIPQFIEYFSLERDGQTELYLIQEYIEGTSLAQRVQQGKHFTEQEIFDIAQDITDTLEYLQSFSPPIIHRDIKPSNIIITPENRAVLIDFGAVRDTIRADHIAGGGGSTIVGTYGYMPVEQYEGRALPATDVYSLGMTLVYALSGKDPLEFERTGTSIDYQSHINVSKNCLTLLEKMLTRDPAKRYADASALNNALKKIRSGKILMSWRRASKVLLPLLLIAIVGTAAGVGLWYQMTHASRKTLQQLETLLQDAQARFLSREDELGALTASVKAGEIAFNDPKIPEPLRDKAFSTLQDIVYHAHEKNRLPGHQGTVSSVAFNPDGAILASGGTDDKSIKLWDVATGQELETLQGHTESVWGLDFSPDGTLLASGSFDHTVRIWDVANRRSLMILKGHTQEINAVAFSPDGTLLASGGFDGVKLWDVQSGQGLNTLTSDYMVGRSLAFHPAGRLLASGSGMRDGMIVVWDVPTGNVQTAIQGHIDTVVSHLVFSPDGHLLASGGKDRDVRLWNSTDWSEVTRLPGTPGNIVLFSPDGTRLITGNGSTGIISVWAIDTDTPTLMFQNKAANHLYDFDFSPDGNLLASAQDGGIIKLWTLESVGEASTLSGHTGAVNSIAFNQDGTRLASAGADSQIILWDVATRQKLATLTGHTDNVESLDFSPDSNFLVSGSGGENGLIVWDMDTLQTPTIVPRTGLNHAITSVAFHPDSTRFASGAGQSGSITIRTLPDGNPSATFSGLSGDVESLCFSPDGKLMAAGGTDSTIRIWDAVTKKAGPVFQNGSVVKSLAFDPNGTTLAAGGWDHSIALWNVEKGKLTRRLTGHSQAVQGVAFHPSGQILASGSSDATIKLWNVSNGREIATLSGQAGEVFSVDFHPNTALLASGGADGSIRLWDVDGADLLRLGCERLQTYLHNNPQVAKSDRGVCDDLSEKTLAPKISSVRQESPQTPTVTGEDVKAFAAKQPVSGMKLEDLITGESLDSAVLAEYTMNHLGVVVREVLDGSLAEQGGLQAGDQIIGCDGYVFWGYGEYNYIKTLNSEKETLDLIVRRTGPEGGETELSNVTLKVKVPGRLAGFSMEPDEILGLESDFIRLLKQSQLLPEIESPNVLRTLPYRAMAEIIRFAQKTEDDTWVPAILKHWYAMLSRESSQLSTSTETPSVFLNHLNKFYDAVAQSKERLVEWPLAGNDGHIFWMYYPPFARYSKVISASDNEIHIADKQFLTAILPEKAAQFSLASLSEMAYTYSTLESSATEAFIGQVKASLIEPLQHAGWPSRSPLLHQKNTRDEIIATLQNSLETDKENEDLYALCLLGPYTTFKTFDKLSPLLQRLYEHSPFLAIKGYTIVAAASRSLQHPEAPFDSIDQELQKKIKQAFAGDVPLYQAALQIHPETFRQVLVRGVTQRSFPEIHPLALYLRYNSDVLRGALAKIRMEQERQKSQN